MLRDIRARTHQKQVQYEAELAARSRRLLHLSLAQFCNQLALLLRRAHAKNVNSCFQTLCRPPDPPSLDLCARSLELIRQFSSKREIAFLERLKQHRRARR
jgi:hypothetical protein